MAHPLIPQIIALAQPVASTLNLEVVDAHYQTNQHPPVLRIDVRNQLQDTSLEDCEHMSRALEAVLDATDLLAATYVLEVSSPGLSPLLTTDRDFIAFRGFPVMVQTQAPFRGAQQWIGTLTSRDQDSVILNQKGRNISIPRPVILQVQLQDSL